MPDQDKDAFETGEPNEFMPGEDDFEDEFEGEEEEGLEETPEETRERERAGARGEAETGGRRFRFGRGGGEEEEHAQGSLRTSHERVHIDDRLSAVFVLVCVVGLVGILIGGYLGQYAPKGGAKPLPTLSLETFQASPTPEASGSASLVPTASPSASPTASPSAS
jgi:hypothetical protein